MKNAICLIICTLLSLFVNAETIPRVIDTTYKTFKIDTTSKATIDIVANDKGIDVGGLTLVVNSINNVIAWSAAVVAILTLLVAIVGYFGFSHVREVLKQSETKIADKILTVDAKLVELKSFEIKLDRINEKINAQEKFTSNSIVYIYGSLDSIVNQITAIDDGKKILAYMLHNYQIANLYSTDEKKTFAAIAYLQSNGTTDDIEHLEFVSNYDSDEYNKKFARETIGIIKYNCQKT